MSGFPTIADCSRCANYTPGGFRGSKCLGCRTFSNGVPSKFVEATFSVTSIEDIAPVLSPFKGITTTFVRSGCKVRPLAIDGGIVPVDEQCNGDLLWYDSPKGRREYVVCNGRYLRIVPVLISKRKGKEAK